MKHSWKAPPKLQALSYRVLPSRRRVIYLLDYLSERALNLAETQEYISRKLLGNEPFLVGRPGGTESEGLYFFAHNRLATRAKNRRPYSPWFRKYSQVYSGITHKSDEDLDYFNQTYLSAVLSSDLLAFGQFAPGALGITRTISDMGAPITHFDSLEPWVCMHKDIRPWTFALEGKKVLVVHPFTESISKQLARKTEITGVKDFLPEFSYKLVAPPVTFAGERSEVRWRDNLASLVNTVANEDFDVALIGAGAYGLPLGSAIRASGRQAIHLGGITQLLFGVSGSRWGEKAGPTGMADSTWIRPSENEKPSGHKLVENGAYW